MPPRRSTTAAGSDDPPTLDEPERKIGGTHSGDSDPAAPHIDLAAADEAARLMVDHARHLELHERLRERLEVEPPQREVRWPSVQECVANVKAELEGIRKLTPEDRRRMGLGGGGDGERGVSYAYRGIDQIAGALQRLEGKHGVVMVPEVTDVEVKEFLLRDKPWTDTTVRVSWRIYGPGGDYMLAATVGVGRDNSDKGANKALTQARKNLLLAVYNIGDATDDGDHERVENEGPSRQREPEPEGPPTITDAQVAMIREAISHAGDGEESLVKALQQAWLEQWGHPRGLPADQFDEAWSWLHEQLAALAAGAEVPA